MKCVPLIFVSLLVFSGASSAQETPHYDVVAEFIHELGETKNSQDVAMSDMAETAKLEPAEKNQQIMANAIRNSTRVSLNLRVSIQNLKGMKLNKPFETLIPYLIQFNKEKLKLHSELIKIAKVFIGGPKPNIDYSKFSARMPEITAEMENADKAIFKSTPLIFALLIDQKPDSQNHVSHLIITKEQGGKLIGSLNSWFGASMDDKNQNWTVSSASVLRTYFTEKGYKYSDDPWE